MDTLRKEKAALSSVLTKREREALGSGLLGLITKTGGPTGDTEKRMYLYAWHEAARI